jgi:hypothetical protein
LDRALASGAKGRTFKSSRARHIIKGLAKAKPFSFPAAQLDSLLGSLIHQPQSQD